MHSRSHTPTSAGDGRTLRRIVPALLAVALVLSACGRPTPEIAAGQAAPTSYELGPGDKVRVTVFGDESLSGEHQLDGDGALTMPLIGQVDASGLTSTELTERLQDDLTEYMRDPRVNVQVLSNRPFYILGEVRNPGSYAYVDGMTVMNAVAIAGGFTYRARESEFVIDRKNREVPLAGDPRTPVLPGDVITVPERYF